MGVRQVNCGLGSMRFYERFPKSYLNDTSSEKKGRGREKINLKRKRTIKGRKKGKRNRKTRESREKENNEQEERKERWRRKRRKINNRKKGEYEKEKE